MQIVINTIITTATSTIAGAIVGFIIARLKSHKNGNEIQNKALRDLLKSNLVNQYYSYNKIGKVPKYIKEAWYDMFESYTNLGGNSFIKHDIEPKFSKLDIDND